MELENKYNHSIVYKIVCNVTGLVYIGSTTKGIDTRLIQHKADYKRYLAGRFANLSSFEIIKNNNYYIKKIKSYNFDNNDELLEKEAFWIKKYGSVNKFIPNRTQREYYLDNKIEINAKHNAICICTCNCTYTQANKAQHYKTKKHLLLMAQI